jgi:hypothetical protein
VAPPFTVVVYGPPVQYVSSLIWMRSSSVFPNTIAPSRPLPTGSAFSHFCAGWAYQSSVAGSNAAGAADWKSSEAG